MKLIHYSDKPLGKILSVQQHDLPGFKPKGLWVSIDDNGEGWIVMPDGLTVAHHVSPKIAAAYETGTMPPLLLGHG